MKENLMSRKADRGPIGHPGLTLRCTFRIVINNVTTFQNHLFVGETNDQTFLSAFTSPLLI